MKDDPAVTMVPPAKRSEDAPSQPSLQARPCFVGFFLAVRTVTVLLAVRLIGAEPELGTAANIEFEAFLLTVVGFCTWGGRRQPGLHVRQLLAGRWALLFLGFSACSLLWSSS